MVTVDYQPHQADDPPVVPNQCVPCLDITVAIPTYNGADRIPQVLDRLRQQSDIDDLAWEVIVCDNNSCDRTVEVVTAYQQDWAADIPLRYCFAAEQGAAFARQRAVQAARGHIIAFLDDDNIPAYDWLSHVHDFAEDYPNAGAFGSQIHGDFGGELPPGFADIACFLAIVERGSAPHLYEPKSKILPPAAGLAVRRSAWLQAVPERLFLNHKGKSAGLASEDLEALLHIQKAGWEIWYNSDMVVTHQIPGQRLQRDYLVSLLRCVGLSRFYIRLLGTQEWKLLFKVPAYIANDLRKLALHYLNNGYRDATLTTAEACERALLSSIVVSPVFLLKKASYDVWQVWRDNIELPERQKWLLRLTDAFESKYLELYQQAVVDLDTLSMEETLTPKPQFEILLRLRQESSEQPPSSPARFFPTAERYGLMRTLDRRVIQQVCGILAGRSSGAVYALNLSKESVCDPSFLNFLEEQLRRTQVSPTNLCFEIAESTILDSLADVLVVMTQMKSMEVMVAIDDVLGCSDSIDYIKQLSVDCLKLSRNLLNSSKFADLDAVLPDLIKLSRQQGFQIVAKGVETQAALERFQNLGIRYAQGYQVSKPSPFIQSYIA